MGDERTRNRKGPGIGPIGAGIVAALALAAAGSWPRSLVRAQALAAAKADAASALVERQLKLATQALQMMDRSRDLGAPVAAVWSDTILWSRQALEARLFLSFKPDEPRTQDVEVYLHAAKGPAVADRLAAFDDHVRRMKSLEAQYRPLFERGDLSGFQFARIEAARLQAEVWQAREKDRS